MNHIPVVRPVLVPGQRHGLKDRYRSFWNHTPINLHFLIRPHILSVVGGTAGRLKHTEALPLIGNPERSGFQKVEFHSCPAKNPFCGLKLPHHGSDAHTVRVPGSGALSSFVNVVKNDIYHGFVEVNVFVDVLCGVAPENLDVGKSQM